jgi:methylamine---glutamate N-methyltransferase subunit A
MCGITGILFKDPGRLGPIGRIQVDMLQALHRRGPDSTGVALYGRIGPDYLLRARLSANGDGRIERARSAIERLATVRDLAPTPGGLRASVGYDGELGALADGIEAGDEALDVLSVGHSMQIVKEVGSAEDLDRAFHISSFEGGHGIGHTRMATESRVDTLHSHPFWARPFPDIALVHNGHVTNEHKLRRRLEQRGHRFLTDNDSEVLAAYLADQLERGEDLDEVLERSVRELDGSFAYLVSTPDGIGLARDQFGLKPLLLAETDEFVVLASEEIAIRAAFPDEELEPKELGAGEARAWRR